MKMQPPNRIKQIEKREREILKRLQKGTQSVRFFSQRREVILVPSRVNTDRRDIELIRKQMPRLFFDSYGVENYIKNLPCAGNTYVKEIHGMRPNA